jgi:hypothetical protein
MDAAIKAKELELTRGARDKRVHCCLNTKIAGRTKLGITAVKQQICKDGMHRTSAHPNKALVDNSLQLTLDGFVKKRPHPASITGTMKSNKRYQKPD